MYFPPPLNHHSQSSPFLPKKGRCLVSVDNGKTLNRSPIGGISTIEERISTKLPRNWDSTLYSLKIGSCFPRRRFGPPWYVFILWLIYFLFPNVFLSFPQGPGPIDKYKGSLREALTVSFPEIQFTFEGIKTGKGSFAQSLTYDIPLLDKDAQREYWQDVNNQRAFFVEYAKENGFNPYHATSWYNLDLTKMKQKQVRIYLNMFQKGK